MAAQDKVTFKQDLTEPVKIRHYEGVVFTGDDCGNIIKVALFDGGVPYSGGGTVIATAILADGTTYPLTQGSITDNMVSVPLEAGALAVSGLMGLYVKISGGGIICTVLNAIFTVQATDTGMVPAAMVTTVNELVAAIRDAQDSIPADLTNLLAAVAPTFSTATAYSAGAYVWHGGKLYRFTAAHPAGTWTGTDAVEVALGNDVADLKSAFDGAWKGESGTLTKTTIHTGFLNGSGVIVTTSTAWIVYGFTVNPGDTIEVGTYFNSVASNQTPKAVYAFYNTEVTSSNYSTMSSENVLLAGDVKTQISAGVINTGEIIVPDNAVTMLVCCSNNVESATATAKKVVYIGYEEVKTYIATQITPFANSPIFPYPFTLDSTLYRPGYPEQIVYSRELNGIKNLVVIAPDNSDYYVSTLHAYSNVHESVIAIRNTNGRIGSYTATRSSNSDRPTETVTINDANGVPMAVVLIDWSKINKANGLGLTSASTRISEACILRTDAPIRFLPITDYYITNFKQRIYFDEICRGYADGYFVVTATGATYPEITYTDRYVEFNVASTKTFTVAIKYVRDGVTLNSVTITIHANASAVPAKKYMFIGDSYTDSGYMQKWFYDNNPGLVTLYGTRGTTPYLHEGRTGWRVQDYFAASKNGVTNPFYNPTSQTFDFSYYMTNNPSFADVDVVNILLGRNNGFSLSIMTQMQTIINSIHSYNSSIKIYVMVGSNVAADNSGAGKYLQNNQEMNLGCFLYNSVVSYENATIIWQNCNLDDVYDFAMEEVDATPLNPERVKVYTDNVHPSQYGYQSFGVVFNGYMHNILNA